jgi:hypothetical protein
MARRGAFSQVTDGQTGKNGAAVRHKAHGGAHIPAVTGEGNDCARPEGGDRTVLPPGYVQTIRNRPSPGLDASCLWQDDNGIIVQENDLDTICIDNI